MAEAVDTTASIVLLYSGVLYFKMNTHHDVIGIVSPQHIRTEPEMSKVKDTPTTLNFSSHLEKMLGYEKAKIIGLCILKIRLPMASRPVPHGT